MTLLVPPDGVRAAPAPEGLLPPAALALLADLHRRFEPVRQARLTARRTSQASFDAGASPGFLPETAPIRADSWQVAPAPPDLQHRRVEITGPTERKMMVNALNSGADCYMADFEDATSPTWSNLIEGQVNLRDYVAGRLNFTSPEGKEYRVGPNPATLLVRPRGWHLEERHVRVDGQAVSAALFDAAVFLHHNAAQLLARGTGPYLYLPKMEHHLEARLWDEVLAECERRLGLPRNSIRVTCLIETLPAAFQMDEILHELRGRAVGLNAGRWDYLFSAIKVLRAHPVVLPDRALLTMDVPFLAAYAQLLVRTCHRRGAHAMGGMAAFIPDRRDANITATALRKVLEDKEREARLGFDGTWVAHPDLVAVAGTSFDRVLGNRPHQHSVVPPEPTPGQLLDFDLGAKPTMGGLRHNLRAALLYLAGWLEGKGAVAIDHLMEDAATAEISRAQVWQWLQRGARLADGHPVDRKRVLRALGAEMRRIEAAGAGGARLDEAGALLRSLLLAPQLPDFLTLTAYPHLEPPT